MPKKPQAKLTIREILTELVERTNSNMRRLRILEQKSEVMASRMTTMEETMLDQTENVKKALEALEKTLLEESERIIRMEGTIKDIIERLKKSVSSTKIKELETLLDIYNPIKSQFMTKEEVERLMDERLKDYWSKTDK